MKDLLVALASSGSRSPVQVGAVELELDFGRCCWAQLESIDVEFRRRGDFLEP